MASRLTRGLPITGSLSSYGHYPPLFEEERHAGLYTLMANIVEPLGVHRSRAGTGFAPGNHPVDGFQIKTR